jgi:histidine triad (HIT) family protein
MAGQRCAFCDIVRGTEAASFVAREDGLIAFLDSRPVFKGHVLVIPEAHTPDLAALREAGLGPLFSLARRIAAALEEALAAKGAFLAVNNKVSQSVPHLHVHVVPRTKGDGLRGFFWPRTTYASDEEREEYGRRIANALRAPA